MTAKKNSPKSVIVTGAAGFIGSQVVRQLVNENYRIIAYDSLTYSGRLENLRALEKSHGYQFVEGTYFITGKTAEIPPMIMQPIEIEIPYLELNLDPESTLNE